MRLPGEQLVLDTNVLVHLLRKKGPAGALIEQEYASPSSACPRGRQGRDQIAGAPIRLGG